MQGWTPTATAARRSMSRWAAWNSHVRGDSAREQRHTIGLGDSADRGGSVRDRSSAEGCVFAQWESESRI